MKTRKLLLISALISLAFLISSCYKSNNTYNNNTANKVSILSTGFSPASITVSSGSTVTWTNKDNMMHTVTTADGTISSGDIAGGSTFNKTFTTVGTFNYFDSHNPSMTGVIVVTASSGGRGY